MTLSTQEIQTHFKANAAHQLADGRLIEELRQADATTVLRVLNTYTQNLGTAIDKKAQEIAEANGISTSLLLDRAKANFANSFDFIDKCQKAANILESTAALPPEADLYGFLLKYSQLRKDYDAIIELMVIDAF